MTQYPYALCHSFSNSIRGGSKAAPVASAQGLCDQQMQYIANEFVVPATGFITATSNNALDVRFFSTQTEYPMCGHVSFALGTWLVDNGTYALDSLGKLNINLRTPQSTAVLYASRNESESVEIMIGLAVATFESVTVDRQEIEKMLELTAGEIDSRYPVALTRSDFVHLIVPVLNLAAMKKVVADFSALTTYCLAHGIDTVMLFTTETNDASHTVHCREFAPAVGTPEAPATGTTNRALACYLFENKIVGFPQNGASTVSVYSEQGVEMGRPSLVLTEMDVSDGK